MKTERRLSENRVYKRELARRSLEGTRQTSPKPFGGCDPADTFSLDFQTPELCDNHFSHGNLLRHPYTTNKKSNCVCDRNGVILEERDMGETQVT